MAPKDNAELCERIIRAHMYSAKCQRLRDERVSKIVEHCVDAFIVLAFILMVAVLAFGRW